MFEEYTSYSDHEYVSKCKQLKIMPLSDRFDFLDLLFFFKIVKGMIPVELPPYIIPYTGESRLRRNRLDDLCFVSTIVPRTETGPLARGFFYRTIFKWNRIPYEIRELDDLQEFKSKLNENMWDNILIFDDDDASFDPG